MHKLVIIITLIISAPLSWAIVDLKNANFSDTWTDLTVPGSGYDLKVVRTYNSRTLFNGLFGFGWCSDFETNLKVTPENYLRVTECGSGVETLYTPKNADPNKVNTTVKTVIAELKKRNKSLTPKYLKQLRKEMLESGVVRREYVKVLGLKGKIQSGVTYFANGRENETIVFKNKHYVRTLSDGTFQKFDTKGRLSHLYDRNGNFIKLSYKGDKLVAVTDNNGRKLTIKHDRSSGKIASIVGPNNLKATYSYNGEDLVKATTAWKNTYTYKYDDLHNLVRINYPDKTYKALSYNKDNDWVMSFRNRKACMETYTYEQDPQDPKNHYWSTVTKKCGQKVVNRSRFEFFHRQRLDGTGKYLYRVRSDVNGDITDIVYHDIFGKPLQVTRNSSKINYSYYKNGLVKTKKERLRHMSFEYKNSCKKPSRVAIKIFSPPKKNKKGKVVEKRKLVKTVRTTFRYEKTKCNLVFAQNTDGQKVRLKYDKRGRIAHIEDQSKKIVRIKYEERFGKPSIVTRPGLGSIKVVYKADGNIKDVSSKQGPRVAVQVASIFNNLLDIIAPATAEATI